MNGLECARELRARRPGLPVVIVTGYADPAMLDRALAEECRLLRKPFDDNQLREALSAIEMGRAVRDNTVPLRGRSEPRVG
jgi:CheY-like chemotaxis protein